MRRLEGDIDRAARSDAEVLITGEAGVGKEAVARLIHARSDRASAPLVALNCAGLPDWLLESELFGHVRGSFAGAYRDKPGVLEMAPHGTLFLDEVGEMSARMQPLLLRFLETGEIHRLGAKCAHARVDVRVITATTPPTPAGFTEDLYGRPTAIRVLIPPLRERAADIPLLISYFVDFYCTRHSVAVTEVSTGALEALTAYPWPGNIRELKNVVERLVLKTRGSMIRDLDLPHEVTMAAAARPSAESGAARPGVTGPATAGLRVDSRIAKPSALTARNFIES
jgi:DNA-binding NtrC family response regulator